MNEQEIYNKVERWLLNDKSVVIANVVETWGSSPRPVGSIMAINDNNETIGSVSGGCVESFVFSKAMNVMKTGKVITLDFGVSNSQAWEVGLTCGGKIKVFLERLDNLKLDYIKNINNVFKTGNKILVATRLKDGKKEIISTNTDNKEINIKDDFKHIFEKEVSALKVIGEDSWFLKLFKPHLKLLIVGAVHISEPLINIAKILGYEVLLIDPRNNFKNEAFSNISIYNEWPDEALKKIVIDSNTAIITLTHDPKLDDPALEYSLKSNAFYIGCLGSKKTHASRLLRLERKGCNKNELSRLNGPIGLDIRAKTPQEIAIAIISQIIEKKNKLND